MQNRNLRHLMDSLTGARIGRMLPGRNTPAGTASPAVHTRCRRWTGPTPATLHAATALLVLTLTLALAAPARTQPAPPPANPALPATPGTPAAQGVPRLDEGHGRMMHTLVEQWARNTGIPTDQNQAPVWVADAAGVRVTLRWLGLTMGEGQAMATLPPLGSMPNPAIEATGVDLVALTRLATLAALEGASDRLLAARLKVPGQPAGGSEQVTLAWLGPRLQVDVQIARRPEAVILGANIPAAAMFQRFVPGYHGLCMTRTGADGSVNWAFVWPASALAANLSPYSQFVQLLDQLGYSFQELPKVGKVADGGPALGRFTVVHVVRPGPELPVCVLERGHAVLPLEPVSGATLDAMAQRLAEHLSRRLMPEGGMRGTYMPTADKYDPTVAPAYEQAMAALALARRAAWLDITARGSKESEQARAWCASILTPLVPATLQATDDAAAPGTAALLLLTITQSPHLSNRKVERDSLARMLLQRQTDEGTFRGIDQDNAPKLNLHTHTLAALALLSAYDQSRDERLLHAARLARTWIWKTHATARLAPALPWLAELELLFQRLSDANVDAKLTVEQTTHHPAAMQALQTLAQTLRRRQIAPSPRPEPADVVGAFDLSPTTADLVPAGANPDWRSAHVLTFLATMLRLAPPSDSGERLTDLLSCGLAARFQGQLMLSQTGCYYVRGRADALDGVRISLWDNRLAVEPTAASLLGVTELQRALASPAVSQAAEGR